ncbi:hypothetical protein H5410_056624 [Solanum commersonii]|uniref:Uncharacterized protein n=1 Tax=Solanum commersonii TaxID=4109 RepID=A0A9J5WLU7_SOLCO|nr:hypothetical protein H5410_056624 [Solanum commersonii]
MGDINEHKMHSRDPNGEGGGGTVMQFLSNEDMPIQERTIIQADKQEQPKHKTKKCQNRNHASSQKITSNRTKKNTYRKRYMTKKRKQSLSIECSML